MESFLDPGFSPDVEPSTVKPTVESHLFDHPGENILTNCIIFLLVVFSTQYVDQMFIISQFVGLKKYSIWIRLTKSLVVFSTHLTNMRKPAWMKFLRIKATKSLKPPPSYLTFLQVK